MVTLVLWPRDYHELLFSCFFRYNVDVDILKEVEHEGGTVDGRNPAPVEVGSFSSINRMKGLTVLVDFVADSERSISSTPGPCHLFFGRPKHDGNSGNIY